MSSPLPPLRIERLGIEPPEPSAIDAARLLLREVDDKSQPHAVVTAERIAEALSWASRTSRIYYGVFTEESSVIAAARVSHNHGKNGDTTDIWSMAVAPDYRGQHVGRTLVQHIAQQAIEVGDSRLALVSLADGFYEKCGFEMVKDGDMIATPDAVLNSGVLV